MIALIKAKMKISNSDTTSKIETIGFVSFGLVKLTQLFKPTVGNLIDKILTIGIVNFVVIALFGILTFVFTVINIIIHFN